MAAFYLGHILADFSWYGLISTVVGRTSRFVSERVYRFIVAGLGILLIYFGGSFVVSAASNMF